MPKINFSISADNTRQTLFWVDSSVIIWKFSSESRLGKFVHYYILGTGCIQEPELASHCSYISDKVFIYDVSGIYYDSISGLIISIGKKPIDNTAFYGVREPERKYILLIMKPLKVEYFKTRPELDKKLEEMGYKKNVTLMDIGKFFDEMKKTAKEID
ncbi:MAG: hypothetical protein A2017_20310 [Lentisphaerae bacterium GWF2_44_16]|nr:MAG: hypothetical protein A2017_20310 [Lentisphaerae bacterium GWF2_44_16]